MVLSDPVTGRGGVWCRRWWGWLLGWERPCFFIQLTLRNCGCDFVSVLLWWWNKKYLRPEDGGRRGLAHIWNLRDLKIILGTQIVIFEPPFTGGTVVRRGFVGVLLRSHNNSNVHEAHPAKSALNIYNSHAPGGGGILSEAPEVHVEKFPCVISPRLGTHFPFPVQLPKPVCVPPKPYLSDLLLSD